MPGRERVLTLIAMVEQGKFVEAIHRVFVFTRMDGTSLRMEELAEQRWRGC